MTGINIQRVRWTRKIIKSLVSAEGKVFRGVNEDVTRLNIKEDRPVCTSSEQFTSGRKGNAKNRRDEEAEGEWIEIIGFVLEISRPVVCPQGHVFV